MTPDATGLSENGPFQAEPFEETLEKFRLRVIRQGGTVEEHYALRKIDALAERLKASEAEKADMVLIRCRSESWVRDLVDVCDETLGGRDAHDTVIKEVIKEVIQVIQQMREDGLL